MRSVGRPLGSKDSLKSRLGSGIQSRISKAFTSIPNILSGSIDPTRTLSVPTSSQIFNISIKDSTQESNKLVDSNTIENNKPDNSNKEADPTSTTEKSNIQRN